MLGSFVPEQTSAAEQRNINHGGRLRMGKKIGRSFSIWAVLRLSNATSYRNVVRDRTSIARIHCNKYICPRIDFQRPPSSMPLQRVVRGGLLGVVSARASILAKGPPTPREASGQTFKPSFRSSKSYEIRKSAVASKTQREGLCSSQSLLPLHQLMYKPSIPSPLSFKVKIARAKFPKLISSATIYWSSRTGKLPASTVWSVLKHTSCPE